jgi:hypothetical protein
VPHEPTTSDHADESASKVERFVPVIRSVCVYGVECSVSLDRSRSLPGLASAAQCEEVGATRSGRCDRRSGRCQMYSEPATGRDGSVVAVAVAGSQTRTAPSSPAEASLWRAKTRHRCDLRFGAPT